MNAHGKNTQRLGLGSALFLTVCLGAGARAEQAQPVRGGKAPAALQDGKRSVELVDVQSEAGKRNAGPKDVVEVSLEVTGLTQENAASVETALRKVQHTHYECAACKVVADEAGSCKGCGGTLAKTERAALREVLVEPDSSTITVDVAPGQKIQLSEVEKALGASKVLVPRERLELPSHTELLLDGVGSEMSSQALEKGLRESKLFEKVTVSLDAKTKQYVAVVTRNDAPVKVAQVSALLTRVLPEAKLADLRWSGPKPLRSAGG